MTFLIRNVINKIDSIYHQKKIFKILKDLNMKVVIDVGAHKGEFLSYLLKLDNLIRYINFNILVWRRKIYFFN